MLKIKIKIKYLLYNMSGQNPKQKLDFFTKVDKMSSELLSFTYGSLIVRLIKDFEKTEEINEQLEKM
jgi:hypothetical protein